MTGLGTVLRRFIRCRVSGPACNCARPSPDAAVHHNQFATDPDPPDLFGPSLTELRAALACYELVDEIVRADGDAPTERDRRAHVFAGWALANAAGRLNRAYHRELDARAAP